MKKILLFIVVLLYSITIKAQFGPEGFNNTPIPPGWLVANNGVGPIQSWTTAVGNPICEGTRFARCQREEIGIGNTSLDWLITPQFTVPANGQLRFQSRTGSAGNQGTLLKIFYSTNANQSNLTQYQLLQTYTEDQLSLLFNACDTNQLTLPTAVVGQQVYLAFVREYTQVATTIGGDIVYIDDVRVLEQCLIPTALTATAITTTTATLSWNPAGAANIEVVLGTGAPTGVATHTNQTAPFNITGLLPNTTYTFYVRAICANGNSNWSAVSPSFTTLIPPPACGGLFYDSGGPTGNYAASENTVTTICPNNPGDVVQVVFTSFQTETNWDRMYIFDGNSQTAPQISSGNGGGNGATCNTVTGGFWGTQLQGVTITSSSPNGCLTFRFCSDTLVQQAGWVANVNCIPAPPCSRPTNIVVSAITSNTATITWNENGTPAATQWEVIILPSTAPPPTDSTPVNPANIVTSNPFNAIGLSAFTNYRVYVRAICANGLGNSLFSGPINFQTLIAPPVCGGNFVDPGGPTGLYPANSNSVTTICPVNPGDVVTVNFTAFQTQLNTDALYIFNGNSVTAPQIASNNGAGVVPGGLAGGYWNTDLLNQTIVSTSPDGCLTFRFVSNATTQQAGWLANVVCIPAPPCNRPTGVTVLPTHNSATISWTEVGVPPATQWEIIVLPAGSPAPTNGQAVNPANVYTTNPATVSGLTSFAPYVVYIRSICGNGSGNSLWTNPVSFTTYLEPVPCGGTYTDIGGNGGNYQLNENSTTVICPPTTGQVVTVTFSAFQTQISSDALYIYNGNNVNAPLIPSANGAGTVPGGLAGGYWNTDLLNQTIVSTSPDGCLTFRFISNAFTQQAGWVANVECIPTPSCNRPTNLVANTITQTSAILSWTENGVPPATQWEVIVLPVTSPNPTNSTPVNPANIVTSNPYTVTGLNSGTIYKYFVRALCANGLGNSLWSVPTNFFTLPANDECTNAINVPVNSGINCVTFVPGTISGATASGQPNTTCVGSADDDVWFSFVATAQNHVININNPIPTTTNLVHAVYTSTGTNCATLTQVACSDPNQSILNNLTIGTTYYIRIYSFVATPGQISNFEVCVATLPNYITTSTTSHTVTQLVQDVLVNSTCATVSNITWKTGNTTGALTTSAAPNGTNAGIGYFNKNNSAFPFQDGIILSTGNVLAAPGPNNTGQSFGTNTWTGDTAIEAIVLAGTGTPMTSRNATVLEFDFIPINNSLSFDFIFASEEYGTFQCAYSDAFAFLLTNTVTGVTTNLAVVPGTTNPISVVTVRDNAFNAGCASVNTNYFGDFYGAAGVPILAAPHNFNGDTTTFTAASGVNAGTLYHIKLVIADRSDNSFDSAVFLKGGSFNIGGVDLGNDYLVSNNNGVCFGESVLLDTQLDPTTYTFVWTLNGTPIPNSNVPFITATQNGTYQVSATYNNTTCTGFDTIVLEFYPDIAAGTPNNLNICSNNTVETFNLNSNNTAILNTLTGFNVSYYLNQTDANAGTNAITNTNATAFQNTSNPQTIYARVYNPVTGCKKVVNFNLVIDTPVTSGTLVGNQNICIGNTTTFTSNGTPGGTWTSSNTAVATVNDTTGEITGVTAGNSTITYLVIGNGSCTNQSVTGTITVTAPVNEGSLSGTQVICIGQTSTFTSNGTTGGTWNSSNIAIATVNPTTGVITGVDAGTATITYTVTGTGGCPNQSATRTVTVTAPVNAGIISGTQNICIGSTTTFTSNGTSGGTWTSSNTAIASVDGNGLITGLTAGTATIKYEVFGTGGCPNQSITRTVTITAPVNAGTISGNQIICIGSTTTFISNGTTGGTWTSSNTAIATVNPTTGVITGITSGTSTIKYEVLGTGGCPNQSITRTVTITAPVNAGTISGNQTICIGSTTTFISNGTTGGTWTSSNTAIASVNPTTGVITGVTAGTTTIKYEVLGTGGCPNQSITRTVTITAPVNAGTISGIQTICIGSTTIFTSNGTSGGTWTSSNTAIATVNPTTGVITGIDAGTATIKYEVLGTGGCPNQSATRIITVNPNATIQLTTNNDNQEVCINTNIFEIKYELGNGATGATVTGLPASITAIVTGNILTISGSAANPVDINYTVNTTGGCGSATATGFIKIKSCLIQNGISPGDGNGQNDVFDLRGYNVSQLFIYNRYGMKVYEKPNYINEWGGQDLKGNELPTGTYFYVIEFKDGSEAKSGWIYVNRAQ